VKMGDLLKNGGFKISDLNMKMPKLEHPSIESMVNLDAINRAMDETYRAEAEKEAKEEAYKEEHLRILKNIEENTKGLDNIVALLTSMTKQQEEVLELLKESLAISTSTDTQEAESKYRQVMGRITTVVEDVGTMQTLYGFANTIYKLYTNTVG
jgi:predicted metalloendopeptidase